ncbi:MAG: bifunctional nuclease family protein [Bacteroidaceae bacterium]
MEKTIELQPINITNSQEETGAYALLMGEINGERELPIIIGPTEAKSATLALKNITTPRPLTHELLLKVMQEMDCYLTKTLIYKAIDGVFYSYLFIQSKDKELKIDSRTSDAVTLAILSKRPIYIYESILEKECLHLKDEKTETAEKPNKETEEPHNIELAIKNYIDRATKEYPIETLKERLKKAIADENYELAAKLRDIINLKK